MWEIFAMIKTFVKYLKKKAAPTLKHCLQIGSFY